MAAQRQGLIDVKKISEAEDYSGSGIRGWLWSSAQSHPRNHPAGLAIGESVKIGASS